MIRISLSFLVDTMDKRRGGCAPNIAYTLALLGDRPLMMATAGEDFGEYRQWLESAGVDTTHVRQIAGKFCASFFCSTDVENNQIASFYTGAMADAGQLSFREVKDCRLAIIAPNDPGAMVQYADECRALHIPFIFDPGQQCARMEGDQLRDGITGASIVIVNDYELELLRQKTAMSEKDILVVAKTLIVTRGEKAILLLNRRGVAPALHCRSCGLTLRCVNCDVALVLHGDGALRCHHCGWSEPAPELCPACGSAARESIAGASVAGASMAGASMAGLAVPGVPNTSRAR